MSSDYYNTRFDRIGLIGTHALHSLQRVIPTSSLVGQVTRGVEGECLGYQK